MSKLVFHERVGLDNRRISLFSWRIRYALAHKGLEPEVVPTHFADVGRIRALSGQELVPVLEHDGLVVPQERGYPALRAWRARMVAQHDGLGDRFAGYPAEGGRGRAGPDSLRRWPGEARP